MTGSMNGRLHTNGRTEPSECRCPVCSSIISPAMLASIVGAQKAREVEIEQAVAERFSRQLADAARQKKTEIAAAVKSAIKVEATKLKVIREHQTATIAAAVAAVLPPTDVVRRIGKGQPGVDVVIEVVYGEGVIGKIAIDSKDHRRWQNAFTTKLRADQIAEDADFAILSSSCFPKNASQLHVQDECIIADPERVPALVSILRRVIVANHIEVRSNEAKDRKAAELYRFLLSKRGSDLFGKLIGIGHDLEALDATEMKNHQTCWDKRAGLIRSLIDVHDTFSSTINDIIEGGK